MKENIIKFITAAFGAGLTAYFRVLFLPVSVLVLVMVLDYISGMTSAYMSGTLSSKIGVKGIIKKLCYLMAVGCGMIIDFIISVALGKAGITGFVGISAPDGAYIFGVLVTVWLIINETISILENLGRIGVPLPDFLKNVSERLKESAENRGKEIKKG